MLLLMSYMLLIDVVLIGWCRCSMCCYAVVIPL